MTAALAIIWLTNLGALFAAGRTITLAVEKMVCAVCAFNLKKSPEGVRVSPTCAVR